jgi:hypothetical protein
VDTRTVRCIADTKFSLIIFFLREKLTGGDS